MELLIEYTGGERKGHRTYVSEATAEKLKKLGREFKVIARVEPGQRGRVVPLGVAGESSTAGQAGRGHS